MQFVSCSNQFKSILNS